MVQVITGYLILAQLKLCIKDNGCCLQDFIPQSIPDLKPLTLEKAGCTLFTLITGTKEGAFQLQGCNGKYITIDGSKIKTTVAPTELALAEIKDMQQYITVTKHKLTETSNPFYVLDSRNGNPKIGQECLRIFPLMDTVDYSNGCDICAGKIDKYTRHAAWNFVEEKSQSISCTGKCLQSIYNGYEVKVENHDKSDARNALLFSPVSFGLKLPATASAKYVISGPTKIHQIVCVIKLKRFCFEARKISRVFINFHTNSGVKKSTQVRISRPVRYRKICLSSRAIPTDSIYKIELQFKRFGLSSNIFFRHLDIRGCST